MSMEWWIWAAIGAAVVLMMAVDWIIVMGTDPKKWKGSKKQ